MLDFKLLGMTGPGKLRDLWRHQDLGTVDGAYVAMVPKHGVVLLKVTAVAGV